MKFLHTHYQTPCLTKTSTFASLYTLAADSLIRSRYGVYTIYVVFHHLDNYFRNSFAWILEHNNTTISNSV